MSTLHTLYQTLRTTALQSGIDQRRTLANGARLTVRVRDGVETVTFARRAAPLGQTEEKTFRRHCGVPRNATRIPSEGQHTRQDAQGAEWSLVSYRWQIDEHKESEE